MPLYYVILYSMLIFYVIIYYFYYILTISLAVGMLLSLKVGITHDESHNNLVWEFNKKKFFNIFFNKNFDVSFLETYHGFYGVGFYYLS